MEPESAPGGVESVDPGFVELYQSSYARLVRALAVTAGDLGTAEEVVQEAFVRLLVRWVRIRSYDDPEAWVRTVALRLVLNRVRNSRIRAQLGRSLRPEPQDAPVDERLDVAAALAMLPTDQRAVLVLHHMLGLPVDEIARDLRIPPGTVKSRLSRGRAALQPLLREELPDDA